MFKVESTEIKMPATMPYSVFMKILHHCYWGDIDVPAEIALPLLYTSHDFQLFELQEACEEALIATIKEETVIKLLETCDEFEVNQLKKSCIDFILENFKKFEISTSFSSLSKELVTEIMSEACGRLAQLKLE